MNDQTTEAPETDEERTARRNFHAEAVRAGMHSSAVDMMDMMREMGVKDVAAVTMTGICQFVAQMHEGLAEQAGVDKSKIRESMLNSIGVYYDVWCEMTVKDKVAQMGVTGAGKQ